MSAWALWALAMLGIAGTIWLHHLLHRASRPELVKADPLLFVALVSAATVGLVLARADRVTRWAGFSWPSLYSSARTG